MNIFILAFCHNTIYTQRPEDKSPKLTFPAVPILIPTHAIANSLVPCAIALLPNP
ncbi:MAG: hypothetical protein HC903_24860 [Methylacidiphilales bacterium]|nr:hypothetical protein [Candidatus Methylacidiphilales bacterium]